ncbi:MAG: glycosyltransferase, partial [Candidatus Azobacteroides sp.]|nr:glycosyltransferase [Candidatus Azobacteroides sp.]
TLLREHGHEVAVFSMQHSQNLPSSYAKFFLKEIDFNRIRIRDFFTCITRPLGSKEAKDNFYRLVDEFHPDVVHLNNIHSQLSPVIAKIACQKKIKIVWTLHDYKMLCPRYDCMRNGKACNLCYSGKLPVIWYNCMKNNRMASILAYLEAIKWNREKLEKYTDAFICPSKFMKSQMLAGGFSEEKLMVLPNFVSIRKNELINCEKEDYYCYIGRISGEKGVETLLQVAQQLPYPLKIAGKGPLFDDLQSRYANDKIEFLGYLDRKEVESLVEKARFSVVPSECYENNPLSGIESLCLGTPVLGADIGGIPELIEIKRNGLLFESGNKEDFKNKIEEMYRSAFDYTYIAQKAQKDYSSEDYYTSLMNIYCV